MKIFYKKSPLLDILLLPLILVSVLFRYVTGTRRFLYRQGVLKSYRAGSRIISVGNLTVGGTGKTPMVIYLCTMLAGKKIAVVSRGYRSEGKGIRVVSDGKQILAGPELCGDEPYLIAKSVRHAAVAVGEKKAEVIRFVEERYNPDIIILDDGFSHLRVKRDMDIVLVDGEKGFGNGHLLPAGPLREAIGTLRYADSIGIKGKNVTLENTIKRYAGQKEVFRFNYRFSALKTIDDDTATEVKDIKDKRVLAVAGIAFPDSFFKLLDSTGIRPFACIAAPDHSRYDEDKIARLTGQYAPDVVLVTAKDAVKIKAVKRDSRILWLYADIVVTEDGENLKDILRKKGLLE